MLDFDALTLPQVVAELNRYSDTPVLIADPSLNDTRVSGVFAIGDTETLQKSPTAASTGGRALPAKCGDYSVRLTTIWVVGLSKR